MVAGPEPKQCHSRHLDENPVMMKEESQLRGKSQGVFFIYNFFSLFVAI